MNTDQDAMIYQDLGAYSDIHTIFNDVLKKYNESNQEMNLVLFEVKIFNFNMNKLKITQELSKLNSK